MAGGWRSRTVRTITQIQGGYAVANVFPITCAATQAQVALVSRIVNHISATTQAQVCLVTRLVSHNVSATQAQSASCTRGIGHICAATQAQSASVVRVVNHNVSCTQGQSALVVAGFQGIVSAGGGGSFGMFSPPRFPNQSATNPFQNPFNPRVTKR